MKRRIIYLIITLIILTGGIIVCAIRWNAWFGNQPESDYVVAEKPHNIILSFGENAASARNISWRCDTILQDSYIVLTTADKDTSIHRAKSKMIESRNGKAAFYYVTLQNLEPTTYSYKCITAGKESPWRNFEIKQHKDTRFLVFGDVQDKQGQASTEMFHNAFSTYSDIDAIAFVGDIIERPMDSYYQLWFRSMENKQETTPIIAATGNHEYLKGVVKTLDSRWTSVFKNPLNGPERYLGCTYYIDFPTFRFIVIDTDALHLISDYTITHTWVLEKLLEVDDERWKIVMMHHPVYSAGKNRDNPTIKLTFSHILHNADLVLCGHDHNYMRRGINPVYLLTTSSEKYYEPKQEVKADVHKAYSRFYEYIEVNDSTLHITTISVDTDSIFDSFELHK